MAIWFYSINGQQLGPVEEPELRALIASGKVSSQDMVWREGTPQWIPASAANLALGHPLPAGSLLEAAAAPDAASASMPAPAPVMAPLGDDPGPFTKLGSQFKLGMSRWSCVATASPGAIYILKLRNMNTNHLAAHFGLLGILLMAAFRRPDEVRTCDISELPQSVRQALDPKGKRKTGNVIVLPKAAIRRVKSGILHALHVEIGNETFALSTSLFGGAKVYSALAENGWVLDLEMTPTMAPIHGLNFGRTAKEIAMAKPAIWPRVALAIVAVGIIILIIALAAMSQSGGR